MNCCSTLEYTALNGMQDRCDCVGQTCTVKWLEVGSCIANPSVPKWDTGQPDLAEECCIHFHPLSLTGLNDSNCTKKYNIKVFCECEAYY